MENAIEKGDLINYMGIYFISDEENNPPVFEPDAYKHTLKMSSSHFAMIYDENLINNIIQLKIHQEKCSGLGCNSPSISVSFKNNYLFIGLLNLSEIFGIVALDTNAAHLKQMSQGNSC